MTTSRIVSIAATAFTVILAGCVESTQVRSYPAGSKVYVNDAFIGLTPVYYQVSNAEIGRDFRVRLEHAGYQSVEATLRKEVCRGRVVAAVFTLGILRLFRNSSCFTAMNDFALAEAEEGADRTSTDAPSIEARLQRLKALREQGVITDEELRRSREAILREP